MFDDWLDQLAEFKLGGAEAELPPLMRGTVNSLVFEIQGDYSSGAFSLIAEQSPGSGQTVLSYACVTNGFANGVTTMTATPPTNQSTIPAAASGVSLTYYPYTLKHTPIAGNPVLIRGGLLPILENVG